VNLLELAQALHREVGAAGVAPSSIVNARGEWARLINYVIRADQEIGEMWENWKFQRSPQTLVCTPSNALISAPTDPIIKFWDDSTFMLLESGDSAGDEYGIESIEYDERKSEPFDRTEGLPWRVTIMPDNSFRLEQVPDAAHTILADGYREHPLMDDTDNDSTSIIPARYHFAILGKAIRKYANFEGAAEISQESMDMWDIWLPRLENNQLPNKNHARFRTGARIEVIGGQD
jgi:hypothetical protein